MRRRGDDGVSTVEFALVLPIFLILISIGAFFAWNAYEQTQVDRAASRAARFAAVPTTAGTYEYCPGKVLDRLNDDMFSGDLTAGEVTVTTRGGTVSAGLACPTATPPDGYVRVSVDHTITNPFFGFLGTVTGTSGTFTLSGSGQARVESR